MTLVVREEIFKDVRWCAWEEPLCKAWRYDRATRLAGLPRDPARLPLACMGLVWAKAQSTGLQSSRFRAMEGSA